MLLTSAFFDALSAGRTVPLSFAVAGALAEVEKLFACPKTGLECAKSGVFRAWDDAQAITKVLEAEVTVPTIDSSLGALRILLLALDSFTELHDPMLRSSGLARRFRKLVPPPYLKAWSRALEKLSVAVMHLRQERVYLYLEHKATHDAAGHELLCYGDLQPIALVSRDSQTGMETWRAHLADRGGEVLAFHFNQENAQEYQRELARWKALPSPWESEVPGPQLIGYSRMASELFFVTYGTIGVHAF